MARQIKGQMTLDQYYMDNFSLKAKYQKEGFTNCYDAMPDHECVVMVIDRADKRWKCEVKKSLDNTGMVFDMNRFGCHGYEAIYWKEIEDPDKPPELAEFSDYVGKCEYCMWYGYGLYDPFSHKRRKGMEGLNCQWEKSKFYHCTNGDFWKPGEYAIPKLCSNCYWSNSFCYQKKPEYKENSREAFHDPVEEPNIYCTREDGSVNRREVFRDFWEDGFGPCRWDRQHEWDTCDAWRSDGWKLKRGE